MGPLNQWRAKAPLGGSGSGAEEPGQPEAAVRAPPPLLHPRPWALPV